MTIFRYSLSESIEDKDVSEAESTTDSEGESVGDGVGEGERETDARIEKDAEYEEAGGY